MGLDLHFEIVKLLFLELKLCSKYFILQFPVPGSGPVIMVQQADKSYHSGHNINQYQNEIEILAHGRHDADIEAEQENKAAIDDQDNYVG